MNGTRNGARPWRRAGLLLLLGLTLANCSPAAPPRPTAPERPPERPPTRVPATIRLGVIVPSGGEAYLQQYAEAVLEGVRVAAAQLDAGGDYRVELEVRPISTGEQAAAAVRELGGLGVVGVIGPLLEANVGLAAAARPDTGMVIVSPTAANSFASLPNVYALNVPDTLGASALAAYAARAGLAPFAVLRARSGPALVQARAFSAALQAASGRAPLELTFEPGATNYGTLLRRLRDARVRSVFVAAEESDLRQLLPQVRYYGAGNAQLLATGPWATPDGLERIGLANLEGVIITLPFLPTDSAGPWLRFVHAYETLHWRSLDNAVPALGYDAAALLLASPAAGRNRPAARLRAGAEVAGATGTLVPLHGSVGRRPVLVRVRGGQLVPLGGP